MKTLCLLLSAWILLSAPAHAAETSAPPLKRVLNIREVVSPGGIKAWLVEDHSLPVIAMEFSFKDSGSARDPHDKQGLARLVSNTMDEGAGTRDSQAFQKALTDHSISLSFDAGRDDFSGSLKTLTRHKDMAFDLMKDALNAPRFDQEAVDRMRDANISRIKSSLTDPDWMAARILNDQAWNSHPYAMNSGGTLTTLKAVTREDLTAFVKDNLTRDHLMIGVAGDIAPEELGVILDRLFSGLPEKSGKKPVADTAIDGKQKIYLYRQDIPQSLIEIIQPGIRRKDPDFYAAQIMNFILGGSGFGSRLTEELREKRGLTYGISSSFLELDHATGFNISLSTENKNAGHAFRLIQKEIERMRTTPVTDEELAAAKSYIVGSLPLSLTSTGAIAGTLLSLQQNERPIDHLDQFPKQVRAVTIADVQRVARKVLAPEKALTVIVGKPEGLTPSVMIQALPNVE